MLWRAHFRHLYRHPWQLILAILGIALGVAVVIAVDLANASAERAFVLSDETLSGRTTDRIVGGPEGLAEGIYPRLRVAAGLTGIAPVVEGYATTPAYPGRTFRLLGVDPFAEAPFRQYTAAVAGNGTALGELLSKPATVLMQADTAQDMGLRVGDTLGIVAAGHPATVTLVGLIHPVQAATRQALSAVLIADIATAQELLHRIGRLSRIDVVVDKRRQAAELAEIRRLLPPGATVVPAKTDTDAMVQMTRAFRVNLTALSLLALVVGAFLIYNTMGFAVLQRRTLIGTLRALGVTRAEIFRLVILEALLIGAIGTALGLGMGIGLGTGLLKLVTRTISDVYFLVSVNRLNITALTLGKGLLLGLGAAVVAALRPAVEATHAPPRAVLSRSLVETRSRRMAPRAALAGVLVLLAGTAILLVPSRSLIVGLGGLFTLILGFALLAPAFTIAVTALARRPLGRIFGILGSMAARGVRASLSRTGVAIAALTIAVATTVGVGIMIGSFRLTVVHWLANTLRADIYITVPDTATGATIPAGLRQSLEKLPGVAAVSAGRRVTLRSAGGITDLFVLDAPRRGFEGFHLKQGNIDTAWQAFRYGDGVLVSEPYAYRHHVGVGDRVVLRTDAGERAFPVVGVYYDYSSGQGIVAMDRHTYDRFWHDRSVGGLGVYAKPGADQAGLIVEVRSALAAADAGPLLVQSNGELRRVSMETFDRAFTVTQVLRLLAVLVAFAGILSALMALQLERARELAVMRAYGLTPGQIWGLVTTETGLMGLCAGLLALPLGLSLALVLILVINRRSFGWSMQVSVDPAVLGQALALAIVAAVVAGIYPALKMARTPPALALREE